MLEVEIVPYFVTNIYKGLSHKDCLALDNVKFRNMDPQESGSDDETSSTIEDSPRMLQGVSMTHVQGACAPTPERHC